MNWKALLLAGFVSINFVACDDDDDSNEDSPDMSRKAVENTVEKGKWEITQFIDSGKDETDDYNGYEFTFASNGDLTATNPNNTISGTWNVIDDNSDDDDDESDLDFVISFNAPKDLVEISDDWDIKNRTDSTIELIDDSDDNDTETLTFEKL